MFLELRAAGPEGVRLNPDPAVIKGSYERRLSIALDFF